MQTGRERREPARAPGPGSRDTGESQPLAAGPALAQSAVPPAAQHPRDSRTKKTRRRCELAEGRASHEAAAPIKTGNSAILGVSPGPCQEGAGSPRSHSFIFSHTQVVCLSSKPAKSSLPPPSCLSPVFLSLSFPLCPPTPLLGYHRPRVTITL